MNFFEAEKIRSQIITVAIKLEKNKQNPLSALEALLLAQNATKNSLKVNFKIVFTTNLYNSTSTKYSKT